MPAKSLKKDGAPEKIRTPNLLIRSQTLYPVELRAHLVHQKPMNQSAGNYSIAFGVATSKHKPVLSVTKII
jgi:hypothetical protein